MRQHCKYGHEFAPGNTKMAKSEKRVCLICQRERSRKQHAEWISRSKNPPRSKESRQKESAECHRLRSLGVTVREIAQLMSLAESTVYERLKVRA